jgi:hypothetical protein
MSDILANVRIPAVVLVLALTGCGASHDQAKRPDWRAGADDACFRARNLLAPLQAPSSFRTAELVAGAVALAVRDELCGAEAARRGERGEHVARLEAGCVGARAPVGGPGPVV